MAMPIASKDFENHILLALTTMLKPDNFGMLQSTWASLTCTPASGLHGTKRGYNRFSQHILAWRIFLRFPKLLPFHMQFVFFYFRIWGHCTSTLSFSLGPPLLYRLLCRFWNIILFIFSHLYRYYKQWCSAKLKALQQINTVKTVAIAQTR